MKFSSFNYLSSFCLLLGILSAVRGGNFEDGFTSSESDEARSVVSPELFNWEAAKKGISSFIVPIIPGGSNASSVGNAVENFLRTGASQVSSAIEGAVPEDVRSNVQLASAIVQSSSKNFGDLIFPEGENTSLADGFSNAVNEIQATAKELHGMGLHEKIGQSLLAKLMPADEDTESVEQVHNSNDFASQRGEEEMYTSYGDNAGVKTSSTTWTIVTILVVAAIIVNVVVFYAVYKRKKSSRKTTQESDLEVEDAEQKEKLNASSDLP